MATTFLPFEHEPSKKRTYVLWLSFLLLALLLHALLFLIRFRWAAPSPASAPRVDLQEITPKKLENIRKKWKEKGFLLDKNPSLPSEKEASPDARYFSDRNTRVEKEQRARESQILPKPGTPGAPTAQQAPSRPQPETKLQTPKAHPAPAQPQMNLSHLGVPFHLDQAYPNVRELASRDGTDRTQTPAHLTPHFPPGSPHSGDQAILDKSLPTGNENLLNTQESIYYSFYARIYEAIGPVWQSQIHDIPRLLQLKPREYRTEVDVILDENGNVIEVKRLQSSGVRELDEAIDAAWRKVSPFPNPPRALLDAQRQVHTGWTFSLNVREGIGFEEAPPFRNY